MSNANYDKGEWYSQTITGYVVTASALSIGLTGLMWLGVV